MAIETQFCKAVFKEFQDLGSVVYHVGNRVPTQQELLQTRKIAHML